MSPTLFKIYINTALKEWSRNCKRMGLKIEDNYYLHNLLYADDQILITRGAENPNYIGRKLEEEYEKWGLKISYGKAKYLGTDHSEELQINGNTIPTVKQFKYLGSIVQENGSSVLEVEKRIGETRRVNSMLNSVPWNRNILHSTKLLIYKSTVKIY
jgi:hypothetical protein